jgi:hypothetical protein
VSYPDEIVALTVGHVGKPAHVGASDQGCSIGLWYAEDFQLHGFKENKKGKVKLAKQCAEQAYSTQRVNMVPHVRQKPVAYYIDVTKLVQKLKKMRRIY